MDVTTGKYTEASPRPVASMPRLKASTVTDTPTCTSN